jgi:hypothetical protein
MDLIALHSLGNLRALGTLRSLLARAETRLCGTIVSALPLRALMKFSN